MVALGAYLGGPIVVEAVRPAEKLRSWGAGPVMCVFAPFAGHRRRSWAARAAPVSRGRIIFVICRILGDFGRSGRRSSLRQGREGFGCCYWWVSLLLLVSHDVLFFVRILFPGDPLLSVGSGRK